VPRQGFWSSPKNAFWRFHSAKSTTNSCDMVRLKIFALLRVYQLLRNEWLTTSNGDMSIFIEFSAHTREVKTGGHWTMNQQVTLWTRFWRSQSAKAQKFLRCGKVKDIFPFEGLPDTLQWVVNFVHWRRFKLSTLKLAVIGPRTRKVRIELSRATKSDLKWRLVSLDHSGRKKVLSRLTMVITSGLLLLKHT
jgi:hypothetical protein